MNRPKSRTLLAGFVAALGLAGAAPALGPDPFTQPLEQVDVVRAEHLVRFRTVSLKPNPENPQQKMLTVELQARTGVMVYADNLEFQSDDTLGEPFRWASDPKPSRMKDPLTGKEKDFLMAGAHFQVFPPKDLADTDAIRIRFAACNENICLLPTLFRVPAMPGAFASPLAAVNAGDPFAAALAGAGGRTAPAVDATPRPSPASAGATPKPAATPLATPEKSQAAATPEPTPESTARPPVEDAALSTPAVPAPAAPAMAAAVSSASEPVALTDRIEAALAARSWLLIPLLVLAGLLMNLTPCIYPMIPVTIGVLGSFGTNLGPRRRRLLPLAYVAGIALAYSTMGTVAALSGSVFGSLLQNTWVLIGISALMALLGLTMLGVLDISRLQAAGARISGPTRVPEAGVFVMGAVSSLVAAPCAGPVLATLLVLAGQTGAPLYSFGLLFAFSLGFGLPYALLGHYAGRGLRVPKIGRLMEVVKHAFAGLMFGLALYYLKTPLEDLGISSPFSIPPWFVVAVVAVLLVVAWLPRVIRALGAPGTLFRVGAMTALCFWATLGVLRSFTGTAAVNEAGWMTDYDAAAREAHGSGRALVVDLWAAWCTSCREMDEDLWPDPRVRKALECGAVAAKVDFTRTDAPQVRALTVERKWDIAGLPAVALFPHGADLDAPPPVILRGTIDSDKLISALRNTYAANPRTAACATAL